MKHNNPSNHELHCNTKFDYLIIVPCSEGSASSRRLGVGAKITGCRLTAAAKHPPPRLFPFLQCPPPITQSTSISIVPRLQSRLLLYQIGAKVRPREAIENIVACLVEKYGAADVPINSAGITESIIMTAERAFSTRRSELLIEIIAEYATKKEMTSLNLGYLFARAGTSRQPTATGMYEDHVSASTRRLEYLRSQALTEPS
ncbi:hypothetical protein HYFRA_00005139 [Hymenoscyphus fraxineus]|uniref:Uncharacterized protein n=1 Tax=Hymenoscyphus fraxineus TaxID=746836 RepID=A0A9N9L894_9HELO|nr:hypothetical protein HYFRA_00005139 [Hymenoscyphus fraxineus]